MPDHHHFQHESLNYGPGAHLRHRLDHQQQPNPHLQAKVEEIYAVATQHQLLIATLIKQNAELSAELDETDPLLDRQHEAIRDRCQALMDKTSALLISAFEISPR